MRFLLFFGALYRLFGAHLGHIEVDIDIIKLATDIISCTDTKKANSTPSTNKNENRPTGSLPTGFWWNDIWCDLFVIPKICPSYEPITYSLNVGQYWRCRYPGYSMPIVLFIDTFSNYYLIFSTDCLNFDWYFHFPFSRLQLHLCFRPW